LVYDTNVTNKNILKKSPDLTPPTSVTLVREVVRGKTNNSWNALTAGVPEKEKATLRWLFL
jgi:hypothetical protein